MNISSSLIRGGGGGGGGGGGIMRPTNLVYKSQYIWEIYMAL